MTSMRIKSRSTERAVENGSRRRFMARVGVTGLAVAATQFARSTPAFAANYGCCNLAHYPPNTSYSYCSAHAAYIWTCNYAPCNQCNCCETAGNALSAGWCHGLAAPAGSVQPAC